MVSDNFRDRLEEAFESYQGPRRGLAKRIAEACEVTDQAVGRWRRTGKVQRENLAPLADELGVSVEWLLTGRGEMRRPAEVPDMEVIVAGDTARGVDPRKLNRKPKAGDLVVHSPGPYGEAFALRIVDAPDLWPRYNEGEIVVVSRDGQLQSGSDVYVQERSGAGKRRGTIWRLAWEARGEAALDPVTGSPGDGRTMVQVERVEICRPVIAILPPAALHEVSR